MARHFVLHFVGILFLIVVVTTDHGCCVDGTPTNTTSTTTKPTTNLSTTADCNNATANCTTPKPTPTASSSPKTTDDCNNVTLVVTLGNDQMNISSQLNLTHLEQQFRDTFQHFLPEKTINISSSSGNDSITVTSHIWQNDIGNSAQAAANETDDQDPFFIQLAKVLVNITSDVYTISNETFSVEGVLVDNEQYNVSDPLCERQAVLLSCRDGRIHMEKKKSDSCSIMPATTPTPTASPKELNTNVTVDYTFADINITALDSAGLHELENQFRDRFQNLMPNQEIHIQASIGSDNASVILKTVVELNVQTEQNANEADSSVDKRLKSLKDAVLYKLNGHLAHDIIGKFNFTIGDQTLVITHTEVNHKPYDPTSSPCDFKKAVAPCKLGTQCEVSKGIMFCREEDTDFTNLIIGLSVGLSGFVLLLTLVVVLVLRSLRQHDSSSHKSLPQQGAKTRDADHFSTVSKFYTGNPYAKDKAMSLSGYDNPAGSVFSGESGRFPPNAGVDMRGTEEQYKKRLSLKVYETIGLEEGIKVTRPQVSPEPLYPS